MDKRQTLDQALELARSGKSRDLEHAASILSGKPVGGWPETTQARAELVDHLPFRSDRAYTVEEFVAAAYEIDRLDYYRAKLWPREEVQP